VAKLGNIKSPEEVNLALMDEISYLVSEYNRNKLSSILGSIAGGNIADRQQVLKVMKDLVIAAFSEGLNDEETVRATIHFCDTHGRLTYGPVRDLFVSKYASVAELLELAVNRCGRDPNAGYNVHVHDATEPLPLVVSITESGTHSFDVYEK
jgi:hypothetical protein